MTTSMTLDEALEIYDLLDTGGVGCWVMGGWGVDALVGSQTRGHKDLDVLVRRADIARYGTVTAAAGFLRTLVWQESRRIVVDGLAYDSAFVDSHADGRQVDVHVIDVDDEGVIRQFHDAPWPMPADALSGWGMLADRDLRCVSLAAQLAMHSGYELPDEHRADVRRLEHLARR